MCQDVGTCPCEANVPLIKGDKMKVPIDQASGFTIGLTLVLVTLQLAYRMRPTLRDLALHQATRQAAAPLCAIGSEPFFPRLIVLVVVGTIAGRLIDTLIITKQKPRVTDTARNAGGLAAGLGALTGCWACTQFNVGIWRAALWRL